MENPFYLKLLIDEIRVDGSRVCVWRSHAALAAAIAKKTGHPFPREG